MLCREKFSKFDLYVFHQRSTGISCWDSQISVYLLQAYENCRLDPMICLSLSIASMGRAMQRQADNRNYLVSQVSRIAVVPLMSKFLQAIGFLSQYRALRGAEDSSYADEIEYNYGRAFHHLGQRSEKSRLYWTRLISPAGLLSHAVNHYEKALNIVENRQKGCGDSAVRGQMFRRTYVVLTEYEGLWRCERSSV